MATRLSSVNGLINLTARPNTNKMQELNSIRQTAIASETDEEQFGKPVRQNVCVVTLRAGFRRSFAELFRLPRVWDQPRDRQHKLHTLQQHLTRAETAERAGQYAEVYENHLFLGRFFTELEDVWLKHHFFQLALHAARKFKMDSGKREAEANLHMGQVYLEQGQLELAQEHYEACYHMTMGRAWQDNSGLTLHSRSCEELKRVYTLLAERLLQEQDYKQSIRMFSRAYEMAKELGDRGSEGDAAYRVGLAYQRIGDQTTAKEFLSVYTEISTALGDTESLGRAYEAIAKSLESEGKLTEAIVYLEKFAETSLGNEQYLQKAYLSLGTIFNSKGQYDEASAYFERAYKIACDVAPAPVLQKAQVCVGCARALSMLQVPRHKSIQSIINWKERRGSFSETPCELKSDQLKNSTHVKV